MDDRQLFTRVNYLIFDVDGVFTDNRILVTDDGHFLRSLSTRDGYAVKRGIAAGLKMAIITGGTSIGVEKRFRATGIDIIHSGVQDKGPVFSSILETENWPAEEVLYMGDDLPDRDCLEMAGTSVCPADASPEIKTMCDLVTHRKGGEDCVRELIERILKARDKWK